MKVLSQEALKPENYVYAITDTSDLLNAAADWYRRRYGVEIDPASEVCSLWGSQEGLSHIALTLIDDGDLTLVPDPCYPVFADGPRLAGSEIFFMPITPLHVMCHDMKGPGNSCGLLNVRQFQHIFKYRAIMEIYMRLERRYGL